MPVIDLWEDEPLPEPSALVKPKSQDTSHNNVEVETRPVPATETHEPTMISTPSNLESGVMLVTIVPREGETGSDRVALLADFDIAGSIPDFGQFRGVRNHRTDRDGFNVVSFPLNSPNAFVLRMSLRGMDISLSKDVASRLAEAANRVYMPTVTLSADRRNVNIEIPGLELYRSMMRKLSAYPVIRGYSMDIARVPDLEALSEAMDTRLPKFAFSDEVLDLNREPIPGFDGTLESLKTIPVSVLNVVASNRQGWKATKASNETLAEKLTAMGLKSLFDLLMNSPRNYVDKTNPVLISEMLEGESAVMIGEVTSSNTLSGRTEGSSFVIRDGHRSIRVAFFNQHWLRQKFPVGSKVIVTGKMKFFQGNPSLSGSSIEFADESITRGIVPIYNQSPTKGITTNFIMTAVRELLSRAGHIDLPRYLHAAGKMSYTEALNELHLPTSLAKHDEAVATMSYYELVHLQVLIEEAKEHSDKRVGIPMTVGGPKSLQAKAMKSLPYELTKSQKKALVLINEKMGGNTPFNGLLSADVGSGKTIVIQLAALKSVDSGYQAVIMAPTENLALQLFNTTKKLVEGITDEDGNTIEVVTTSGKKTAAQSRALTKAIKEGNANIIVGTHAVLNKKFANLGFIAIDEQQRFGVNHRNSLINAREDGVTIHTLMASATPVPRSVAQTIYGDVELIELNEKPADRKKIITEWIQEHPADVLARPVDTMWADLTTEMDKGHKVFIVTPLVNESPKIDAANAMGTAESLKKLALFGYKVGVITGQMKPEQQEEVLNGFRGDKYQALVASTVIEVGVDIPEATRVVVLSANRLGLSSLHQIRGRVGRNSLQSKCYLVTADESGPAVRRMEAMVEHDSGFEIARIDLENRGEGSMSGVSQSGKSEMTFVNLARSSGQIIEARVMAQNILKGKWREEAITAAKQMFNSDERMI